MPKGETRPVALRDRARALRAQRYTYREVGEQLGVPLSTVSHWCLDPERSKERARRQRYAGVCQDCGKPTDGSGGPGTAPERCRECGEWSEEAMVLAMQEWAASHDGVPPTCRDWRDAGPDRPTSCAVVERMGWNNLLLKAGFELRCDRRPETQAEMERMLREGWSPQEVADHFGWCVQNVHMRLRVRGLKASDLRRAA